MDDRRMLAKACWHKVCGEEISTCPSLCVKAPSACRIRNPNSKQALCSNMTAVMPSSQPKEGGIKGFLSRAGLSFYAGGMYCKEKSWIAARMAGNLAFIVATTSMVVLMPLIFEIMREGQVRI